MSASPPSPRGTRPTGDGPVRARARVSGLVQGVCYRASTCDRAAELGVAGWVRNCPDGSVELEAEGPAGRVESLLAWCGRGPPGARVTGVEVEWLAETRGEHGFRVRR
ncbi:MAG TPA: acylphosphatase [Kofleriaceae bacterium]|nr:acylphosphatase [Kofleriaceae bacterium]